MKSTWKNLRTVGLTLIELLVVVAIIALLASLAVPAVRGNPEQRAMLEFSQDLFLMLQKQRSRALSSNLASYLEYNGTLAEFNLSMGNSSYCTLDKVQHVPIRYQESSTGNTTQLGMNFGDAASPKRSLLAYDSSRYYQGQQSHIGVQSRISSWLINSHSNPVNINYLLICFQPNGLVSFADNNRFLDVDMAEFNVFRRSHGFDVKTGYISLYVSALGQIYSRAVRAP